MHLDNFPPSHEEDAHPARSPLTQVSDELADRVCSAYLCPDVRKSSSFSQPCMSTCLSMMG